MKERFEWVQSWCDETPSDDVPIIDYHCHLDDKAIKEDKTFSDIGELCRATITSGVRCGFAAFLRTISEI